MGACSSKSKKSPAAQEEQNGQQEPEQQTQAVQHEQNAQTQAQSQPMTKQQMYNSQAAPPESQQQGPNMGQSQGRQGKDQQSNEQLQNSQGLHSQVQNGQEGNPENHQFPIEGFNFFESGLKSSQKNPQPVSGEQQNPMMMNSQQNQRENFAGNQQSAGLASSDNIQENNQEQPAAQEQNFVEGEQVNAQKSEENHSTSADFDVSGINEGIPEEGPVLVYQKPIASNNLQEVSEKVMLASQDHLLHKGSMLQKAKTADQNQQEVERDDLFERDGDEAQPQEKPSFKLEEGEFSDIKDQGQENEPEEAQQDSKFEIQAEKPSFEIQTEPIIDPNAAVLMSKKDVDEEEGGDKEQVVLEQIQPEVNQNLEGEANINILDDPALANQSGGGAAQNSKLYKSTGEPSEKQQEQSQNQVHTPSVNSIKNDNNNQLNLNEENQNAQYSESQQNPQFLSNFQTFNGDPNQIYNQQSQQSNQNYQPQQGSLSSQQYQQQQQQYQNPQQNQFYPQNYYPQNNQYQMGHSQQNYQQPGLSTSGGFNSTFGQQSNFPFAGGNNSQQQQNYGYSENQMYSSAQFGGGPQQGMYSSQQQYQNGGFNPFVSQPNAGGYYGQQKMY